MQPKGSSTTQGALGVRRSLLVGLRCQRQSVTKDFFLQNSLAISDISNKLIVVSSPGKALWSPNELASSAQMRKKKKKKAKSISQSNYALSSAQNQRGEERREEERRGEDAKADQARVSESSVCVIRILSSNCSLSPSCFMAASLPSEPLYDRHCNVFRVLGSLWLGHAVLLSGPEWQWDQVQPPPRTQSHKSSCWHWAPLPEQLPVPAGDKKAFVGFRQPELLLSSRILRFMSDVEKDCEG